MIGKIILLVILVGFVGLGVYLLVQNIKGIKTSNKGIRDCKDAYKRHRNDTFLRIENNWKMIRYDNYMGIPLDLFIIIVNILNVIQIIVSMV